MAEIKDIKSMKIHLQKEELQKIYLFYGPEGYLKDLYLDRIKERLEINEMNRYYFAGDVDAKEIASICSEMSMFGDKNLVIVSGSDFFKVHKAEEKDTDDEKKPDYNVALVQTILESDTYVIFLENEVDKRGKFYKEVLKKGIVFNCATQPPYEIKKQLSHIVKTSNRTINESVLDYMINGVGQDINKLISETEKAILFVPEGEAITKEIVDEVCCLHPEISIFKLNDAVADFDFEQAYKIMNSLLENKEPPIKIIAILSKMWSQLYNVKKLSMEGVPNCDIATLSDIKPFAVKKMKEQANKMSLEYIKSKMKQCQELDENVKSGLIKETVALELLITG